MMKNNQKMLALALIAAGVVAHGVMAAEAAAPKQSKPWKTREMVRTELNTTLADALEAEKVAAGCNQISDLERLVALLKLVDNDKSQIALAVGTKLPFEVSLSSGVSLAEDTEVQSSDIDTVNTQLNAELADLVRGHGMDKSKATPEAYTTEQLEKMIADKKAVLDKELPEYGRFSPAVLWAYAKEHKALTAGYSVAGVAALAAVIVAVATVFAKKSASKNGNSVQKAASWLVKKGYPVAAVLGAVALVSGGATGGYHYVKSRNAK